MTIDIVITNDFEWHWLLTITHLVICYVIIVMNGMVVNFFLFVMTMIINQKQTCEVMGETRTHRWERWRLT
jgi:hypothetical protein